MTNIFEQAVRQKLRFTTDRGLISTEDLFDLPLTSKDAFNLDTIARAVARGIKAEEEESFVETSSNTHRAQLVLKLDILKHIITGKKLEIQERLARAGRAAERARLVEILEKKQDEARLGMTEEEIRARIAELA